MSKNKTKQTAECFQAALPDFMVSQKNYLANRKIGIRSKKGGVK
jgi:hypothetical protein